MDNNKEGGENFQILNMPKRLYEGKSVIKYSQRDIEKGDVGYLSWSERIESIFKIRFFLDDVIIWEEFTDPYDNYKIQATKQVIAVTLNVGSGSVVYHLIESLDVFDMLMDDMNKNKQLDV